MYSVSIYAILMLSTMISAVSGCFNDHLTKSSSASLHALNMWLYGTGTIMNFGYYIVLKNTNESEPGFFQGYSSWGLVILMFNCVIGIVITAVYKVIIVNSTVMRF